MFKAKKSYSQNWLVDHSVVKQMIQAADLQAGERVLEIGPGKGMLTQALVEAGAKVLAVEADRDLIAPLQKRFGDQIKLVRKDILSVDLSGLGLKDGKYKLIANLPYSITSAILEKFLAQAPKPSRLVVMVQKEVADRIVAEPPKMGVLSVACQIYAQGKKIVKVPAKSFRPVPKVDSTVVRLDLVKTKKGVDPEAVIALAKVGFAARRKQLQRNLAAAQLGDSEAIKQVLQNIGLDKQARAENLTVDNWIELHQKLK
ncbi:ribosomal RNA small subunit methyltransferase A [Patescibacteria group bacterium]|nr:ribosomal RNA small subunit methyltransferase A [Patescibacteria group bacterium]MBU1705264.1 ribosomal RNA small subunit methyltransferase A [Patescibacteria group bacterium]